MEDKIPILLDTDPGSDIDDALAIAYMARQDQFDFLGITTVTGDTNQRAGIAEVVLRAYGREDVPIYAGAEETFAGGPGQPRVPQYEAISHLPHRTDYAPNEAVDFLRSTIRSRPGEITLLSIGPLTNIAILFALDPEIPSLLKRFVSMLGHFSNPEMEEWNARCDPAANEAVLRRSQEHTMFGLDVTMRCQLTPEEVRDRFARPPHDIILPMATKWFEGAEKMTFHDPVAVASIIEPSLCTYKEGFVEAIGGRTDFSESEGGRHRVALGVNPESFFDHYFRVLG